MANRSARGVIGNQTSRMVQGPLTRVDSLPAPVGGWNARDPLANMAPVDAVQLTNYFPNVASCELRGGSAVWATGMSGEVESLFVYNGASTSKMFASDSNGKSFYDVTLAGAVGAPVVSGLTNARWEHANISTPGGHFMYTVNGFDKPRLYDGATWTAIDGASVPAITGVTTSNLSNVLLFKNRLWFIERNTLKAWYLPTLSIGGAAQALDMSAFAVEGGVLVDMIAWTLDAGTGVDDMLVFITNQGEVIVWRGTDPASSGSWALAGIWKLGAALGQRCLFKYGGDALMLTLDGLLPLAEALQSSQLDPRVALTDKIQGAISSASDTFQNNFGWQILYYPKRNALWLNVPMGNGQQQQYVMNQITKAWCNFTGWPSNCWELFKDEPYYGTTGAVHHAWDLTYGDRGAGIPGTGVQAFNYFEMRGVEKYFTRARPNILTTGQPAIGMGLAVDFNVNQSPPPIAFAPVNYGAWDIGAWDVALLGQNLTIQNNWLGVAGIGYCAAPFFRSMSSGVQIQWASTDIVFQAGWPGI